ncbi:hypothetical protein [Thermospira aquatica]|uniref:V-type ATP synthase subunit E n=1 Tax=Thermospira aquatica TaxID=2828656 RepID=A0AAX3BCV0_9SPIR|nr:hypothetical protein [Thermospira aquatica]URA10123.1 hypothetical protein KDW03_11675 [Thermospira aquatica]
MALEDILASIRETHDVTKAHLLSQAEYQAGQILSQKKAQLEEWKQKEERLWKEKIERESNSRRQHVDILLEQEKKRAFYEGALALYEESIQTVLEDLHKEKSNYLRFLTMCIQRAAREWTTQEMTIVLAEKEANLFEDIKKKIPLKLSLETLPGLLGGVICRYHQEEINFSFEEIREMMRNPMIQWIYQKVGETHESRNNG